MSDKFIPQYEPVYDLEARIACANLVLSDSWLSDYELTEQFERELCKETGASYCSVVNNGTVAISIALLAMGVKAGDEVIVPNLTMIATATAVEFIGAIPVFADIEKSTFCLDYNKVVEKYTDKTKAVIYVTFNGRINEKQVHKIMEFCKEKKLAFIKDDAQSLGSGGIGKHSLQEYIYGDVHTLSFSPHKIIPTGQGGAILCNNTELFEKIDRIKDFGRIHGGADIHDYFGINSKFTEMQAILGITALQKLREKQTIKQTLYDTYYEGFRFIKDVMMLERKMNHTPWFCDIYVNDRDKLAEYLKTKNIGTRPMYPALNTQKCYNSTDIHLANSQLICNMGLWLPSSFNVTKEETEYIINSIKEYYEKSDNSS
jgi:perosamine synthetase